MRRLWLVLLWTACSSAGSGDDPSDSDEGTGPTDATDRHGDSDLSDDTEDSDGGDTGTDPSRWRQARSGTRLRVQAFVAGGRPVRVAQIEDPVMGVACSLAVAADGVVRCLPEARALDVLYADAACTETRLVPASDTCEDWGYRRVAAGPGAVCGFDGAWEVFRVRDVPVGDGAWAGEGCDPVSPPAAWGTLDLLSEQPLAPSAFVRFDPVDTLGPDGLGVRRWVGEDGTVVPGALVGPSGACTVEALGEDWTCLPDARAERAGRALYGTETCDGAPLFEDGPAPGCPSAEVGVVRDGLTGAVTARWSLGGPWAGDWFIADPVCRSVPAQAGSWRVGTDAWGPDEGAVAVQTVPSGMGWSARMVADVRGRVWRAMRAAPFETAAGLPCAPSRLAGGDLFCLDDDHRVIDDEPMWFADAACTERVLQVRWDTDVLVRTDGDACDVVTPLADVAMVGASWSGMLHQRQASGVCVALFASSIFGDNWTRMASIDPTTRYPTMGLELR